MTQIKQKWPTSNSMDPISMKLNWNIGVELIPPNNDI